MPLTTDVIRYDSMNVLYLEYFKMVEAIKSLAIRADLRTTSVLPLSVLLISIVIVLSIEREWTTF